MEMNPKIPGPPKMPKAPKAPSVPKAPAAPKMPTLPKAPAAPRLAGTEGIKAKSRNFLKVFKPLLYLPLLLLAAALVYYFVPHSMKIARYTIDPHFYALVLIAVLAGILVFYVLLRLFNYILEKMRQRKQEKELGKAEFLQISEGLLARWEIIRNLHKSSGVGLYDMPWYMIVGDSGSDTASLLESSDISIPDGEKIGELIGEENVIDRWVFSREAVFIDTTTRKIAEYEKESGKSEWDALLHLLADQRRRCPVNGILLVLSLPELIQRTEQERREKAAEYLSRIRRIGNILKVRAPVYILISGMERILGFSEFFTNLSKEEEGQIFGWSAADTGDLSPYHFFQTFDDLAENLTRQRFVRGSGNISAEAANRAAFFPEEFACLKEVLEDFVKTLFGKSRFDDALFIRGLYFCGGQDASAPLSLYGRTFFPQGLLESLARSEDYPPEKKNLFVRDLFHRKIFMEAGLVKRPAAVHRKNFRIRLAGAFIIGAVFLLGSLYLADFTKVTLRDIRNLETDLNRAREVLSRRAGDSDTLQLCIRLAEHKEKLSHKNFLTRILAMGRYEELIAKVGTVHRSVFQETRLTRILENTEDALLKWKGERLKGAPPFHVFHTALCEYIRWRNPGYGPDSPSAASLRIEPFLELLQYSGKTRYRYLEQYRLFMEEGGRKRILISPAADEIIRNALKTSRVYMQPAVPGENAVSALMTDSQWWLQLSILLKDIYRSYRSLLETDIPGKNTPAEEMFARYGNFQTYLYDILLRCKEQLLPHLRAGQRNGILWIDADRVYEELLSASRGMPELESAVESDGQGIIQNYKERVRSPVSLYLPVMNMLAEYPAETWLKDILLTPFGSEYRGISPDFGIAGMVLDLLEKTREYVEITKDYYQNWREWKNTLPERMNAANYREPPLYVKQFGEKSHDINFRIRALRQLIGTDKENAVPQQNEEEQSAEEKEKEERKKAVAVYWSLEELLGNAVLWHKVQTRIQMNGQSLYLHEIFKRADFRQGIPDTAGWTEIKSIGLFIKGDGIALAEPVDNFITKWMHSIPQPIRSLVENENDGEIEHYPEMENFEKELRNVMILKSTYMQKLREKAGDFAVCIREMDADPAQAWQRLRESPEFDDPANQSVSWGKLSSFSNFKKILETEQGPICQSITRQLTEIESHVFRIFRKDLLDTYHAELKQIADKYNGMQIREKFPFRTDGPQISSSLLRKLLEEIAALQRRYELDQGIHNIAADGKKTPISRMGREIVMEMSKGGEKDYFEDFQKFGDFLFEKGQPKIHKVRASVIPGQVGAYFHWLRMVFADGEVRDLNVYGEPVAEFDMMTGDGSVSLHGLDAARMPQASAVLCKGDYALLQMLYLFGRPETPERKTWIVKADLPMSVTPSFIITAGMKFSFEAGLPILPDWNNLTQLTDP